MDSIEAPLLSIIIPIYNGAPYLKRAISSALRQTYPNIELILILDKRSTDASEEICRSHAKADQRIRFVWQTDRGLYLARRCGVQLARGDFIAFLDADDFVEPGYYEELLSQGKDYDVVLARWFRDSGDDIRICNDPFPPGEYCTPNDMGFLLRHLVNASLPGGTVQLQPGITAYLWNKLFQARLLKTVFHEIGCQDFNGSEDRIIFYRLMLKCQRVLVTELCGYHYWIWNSSGSHAYDRDCHFIRESVCKVYNAVLPVFLKHSGHEFLIPQLQFKTAVELTRAVKKMGFPPEAWLTLRTPVFPFLNLLDKKRVVLFGAGNTGYSYKRQIETCSACEVVLWVDKRYEELAKIGWNVSSPDLLRHTAFDYIVLAVSEAETAARLREACVAMGIQQDQILWRAPLFFD